MTPIARHLTFAAAALGLVAILSPAEAGLLPHWEESGQASWYGPGFHGKRTSSGEVFDSSALTAAHDSLPLGTRVVVTTQETGRTVTVTITDRLPRKHLRIIDVSRAAAAKLGLLGAGVGMVTLSTPSANKPIEVAEAPDDATNDYDDEVTLSPRRHGPRHTHHGARKALARH